MPCQEIECVRSAIERTNDSMSMQGFASRQLGPLNQAKLFPPVGCRPESSNGVIAKWIQVELVALLQERLIWNRQIERATKVFHSERQTHTWSPCALRLTIANLWDREHGFHLPTPPFNGSVRLLSLSMLRILLPAPRPRDMGPSIGFTSRTSQSILPASQP